MNGKHQLHVLHEEFLLLLLHTPHPPTLTLLVTVGPTESTRTATIVAGKQVLEIRRQGMYQKTGSQKMVYQEQL